MLGGLALLVAGIALAPRRARALRRASLDVALAGLLLVMLEPLGRVAVGALPETPLAQAAAAGVYDAFAGGIRDLALGLAGVGLVFCAAAQTLVSRRWLPDMARDVRAWLVGAPASTGHQVLRGALFVAAGVAIVIRPSATLSLLALAAGACLAFVGLQQLFQLVIRPRSDLPADEIEPPPTGRATRRHAVVILVVAGVVAVAFAWLGRPREQAIVRVPPGCNGDQRLCAKRLDQVVFAGTHNAMSAADRSGWMFAAQERDLATQLDDGVRAFLIDVHAGVPVSGRVKTEMSSEPGFMQAMETAVGTEGLQAAMRIRERLVGPPDGPRALYLCHGFCELGAEPFVAWLRDAARVPGREPARGGAAGHRGLRPPGRDRGGVRRQRAGRFSCSTAPRGRPGRRWRRWRTRASGWWRSSSRGNRASTGCTRRSSRSRRPPTAS